MASKADPTRPVYRVRTALTGGEGPISVILIS